LFLVCFLLLLQQFFQILLNQLLKFLLLSFLILFADLYFEYYKTRRQLSRADRRMVIKRLKAAWQDIDLSLLSDKETRKFGYMPLRFSWLAFRIQAELYFFVRAMRDKMRSFDEKMEGKDG